MTRVLVLIASLILGGAVMAQRTPTGPVTRPQQGDQDVVEVIRASKKPFFEVKEDARRAWDEAGEGDVRERIKSLPLDETLKANVLTGVGILLANENVREVLPAYIDVLGVGRLNETQRRDMFKYVLLPFHRTASIFDEIDAALRRRIADPERFALVAALYPQLVTAVREEGEDAAVERFQAIERLAVLWRDRDAELVEPQRQALGRTLSELSAGTRPESTPAGWLTWIATFRGESDDTPRLELADVYRRAWEEATAEIQRVTLLRREEVGRYIERLRVEGEAPVTFLFKNDPEIRRAALLAISGLAADISDAARGSALDEILRRLESPDSARMDRAVVQDVFAAAGELANTADEARQRRLSREIFAREWPDDPVFLGRVVDVLGKIRIVENIDRLEELYDVASRDGRVDAMPWVELREGLVEISRLHPDGAAFVRLGLKDPRAEVRRVAALTAGLMIDRPEIASPDFALALARQAHGETDPLTTKQILETLLGLVRRNPEPVAPGLIEEVFAAWSHDEPETRRLLVEILHAAARKPGVDPALAARAYERIREALEETRAVAFTGAVAAFLARDLDPELRPALVDWAVARPVDARDASWQAVRDALVPALLADDVRALRAFASRLAALDDPASADHAAAIGAELLERLKTMPDSPLQTEVPAITVELLTWRERGASPANWRAAKTELDRLLSERPNDANLSFRRARLHEKLAEGGDPALRETHRKDAASDYATAVGGGTVGLPDADRVVALRRLLRLRYDAQAWTSAIRAAELLVEADAARPEDRLIGAKAILLDTTADVARYGAMLPGGEGSWRDANPDRAAVLDAALHLYRPWRLDCDAATAHLSSVGSADGELARAVSDLAARAERCRTLTRRITAYAAEPSDAERDALVVELESDEGVGVIVLMAMLLQVEQPGPQVKALFDLTKRVLARNDKVWERLEWPPAGDKAAWDQMVKELRNWASRPRLAAQKSLLAALKAI